MALAGLAHTLGPLESAPLLRPVMGALSGDPVLAVVVVALLTWSCHSSIAIVLLVGSLAATHVVSPSGALAWVLGANVGRALPAFCNASTPNARRLPLGNLLVRSIGAAANLPFLGDIAAQLANMTGGVTRLAVDFHLALNVILALAFLGPVDWLSRRLTLWLPDPPTSADPARPLHLDSGALDSPTVALANAARETLRMAEMVDRRLRGALQVINHDDRCEGQMIVARARHVDQLGAAIRRYLADVGGEQILDTQREAPAARIFYRRSLTWSTWQTVLPTVWWNSRCAA